jgi:cell division septum initiation protein DivIVA
VPKNTSTRSNGGDGARAREERKASQTGADARLEADRIRRAAESDAGRIRREAEDHARRVVLDARASADGVRAEGMELVSHLREMSDVLRSNAERLLRDIQAIHSQMVGRLDQVDPAHDDNESAPTSTPSGKAPDPAAEDEVLEVPDFVSRG